MPEDTLADNSTGAAKTSTRAGAATTPVTGPDEKARAAAAVNPVTGGELLTTLAKDRLASVRAGVAANPHAPRPVLEKLAHDRAHRVRAAAAANPTTPPRALDWLAGADNRTVIYQLVAANPGTPPEVLETMAHSPRRTIREAVAGNPSTPAQVLEEQLADPEITVSLKAGRNHSLPASRLAALANGDNPDVAVVAWGSGRVVEEDVNVPALRWLSPATVNGYAHDSAAPAVFTALAEHWTGTLGQLWAAVADAAAKKPA